MIGPIESGIPIPSIPNNGAHQNYPWSDLKIGDSFFVSEVSASGPLRAASVASKIYAPKKFTARTVNGGVRIWRVS
jgi:hypothetical protein